MIQELLTLLSSKSVEAWPETSVHQLLELLCKKLGAALGTQFDLAASTIDYQEGDITATCESRPACGEFELVFHVRLYVAVSTATVPTVTASVFPFSRGIRLRTKKADLVECTLDPSLGENAVWQCSGWYKDEYDEWDDVELLAGE